MANFFFDFFRRRLAVARKMPASPGAAPDELSPDQHLLVGAGLDALANHWSRVTGGPSQGQERLAEFLAQHGGHACFARVGGPYLLRHAVEHEKRKLAKDPQFSGSHVSAVRDSIAVAPTGVQVVSWRQDDDLPTLAAKPGMSGVPTQWLERWRYGGVIYSEYRCAWVHEFDEGRVTDHSFSLDHSHEPVYESLNGARILVLPGPFLLDTYKHAIDSFEQWCQQYHISP